MSFVSVKPEVKKAKKQLTRIQKKQIPYALSTALNDVAFDARPAEQNAQRQYIDRPTPYTQKGFKVTKSTKKTLVARIEVPEQRWKYLQKQVHGGASTRSNKKHAIPVNQALLNKYGGMPRNKAATLLRRKNHFMASINGTYGVWKRDRTGALTLQILLKQTTQHTASYPLWNATRRVVEKRFPHKFAARLRYALRTAR